MKILRSFTPTKRHAPASGYGFDMVKIYPAAHSDNTKWMHQAMKQ